MSTLFTPELILVIVALALLLVDAFLPRLPKRFLGLIGALAVAWAFNRTSQTTPFGATHTFWYSFSLSSAPVYFSKLLILGATFFSLLMLVDFKKVLSRFVTGDSRNQDGTGEIYILPLFACAGMMWMCSARDFISLFVALELTTLSFYIMVGYLRRNIGSLEGGVKYLITGAMSAGLLVFGIAWLYGTTGSFALGSDLIPAIRAAGGFTPGVTFALALILLGLLFKIGAVPMQLWVPDVYQGAPAPITAFLSVASKTAGLCVLYTFISPILFCGLDSWFYLALVIVTALTIVVGNLGAIAQTNVKRLLGYSSIGHAGYILPFFLLPPVMISSEITLPLYLVYLACYLPMTMGAFFVLSLIRAQIGGEDMTAFRGLGKRNPRLAAVATLMFASLAGVPLTAGFTGKFLSFYVMVQSGLWVILILAIIAAAAGFYYYFKPIRAMYWEEAEEGTTPVTVPVLSGFMLFFLSLAVIALGLLPLMLIGK